MDIVIQSTSLSEDAILAFKVACLADRVKHFDAPAGADPHQAARLFDIHDDADTRKAVAALAAYWKCDVAIVAPRLQLADFRVLAIDMDSTLITIECIDELAALAGKGAEVAAITAAAMRGEIADYADSLRRRVALLAGAPEALLARVYDERLRLSPGAQRLIDEIRREGLKTLLVSGGFTCFTERLRARLQLDGTQANELIIDGGKLTGEVTGPGGGPIIDAQGKAQALQQTCAALGCPMTKAIAIGDGANDLAMLKRAGVSIAYRAKPVVAAQAAFALNASPLSGVLALFADRWPR